MQLDPRAPATLLQSMRSESARSGRSWRSALVIGVLCVGVLCGAAAVGCSPSRPPRAEPSAASPRAVSAPSNGSESLGPLVSAGDHGARARHTYFTRGVHNDHGCVPAERCLAPRSPGQPSDPEYPEYWISDWTMYRVFSHYEEFPPPYASPPADLAPNDYEVSYGTTYYDSTYVPADGDGSGAMMEHYVQRCLPIFPGSNEYTCSFISLGNKAYFLRYASAAPDAAASCCQFSLDNHPPRRDFIEHLPFDPERSRHLGGAIQAYSFVADPGILFGYAFMKEATPDRYDPSAPPYRHPQSFFFSGYSEPGSDAPPNAPIVSQNYSSFRMQKPEAAATWDRVARYCSGDIRWCCLFPTDCPSAGLSSEQGRPATWADSAP